MAAELKRKPEEFANNGTKAAEAAAETTKKPRTDVASHVGGDAELLWLKLLTTKAEELRTRDQVIFIAKRTDNLTQVFKGLVRHDFLSVPVLQQKEHKWFGFVDMMDIVRYVVDFFGEDTLSKEGGFWELIEKDEAFCAKTVNDVAVYPLSRRNPFHAVPVGYSLLHVMELMARERSLHRVPIVDDSRRLISILTQSQVVEFIHKNKELLGSRRQKQVGTMLYDSAVQVVNPDQSTMSAFHQMAASNISGVGVVDHDGKLIDTLSIRDLKGMSYDGRLFWRLYKPLHIFLTHLQKEHQGQFQRPRHPLFCTAASTLEEVLNMVVEHHVHRIFVVDSPETRKPVGILTLRDILLQCLPN